MNESQRNQLIQKAEIHASKDYDRYIGQNTSFVWLEMHDAFMAGAQASWDLAVKAERQRCAEVVRVFREYILTMHRHC